MSASIDTMFLPLYKEVLPTPNRIALDDSRYAMLQTIPDKEYDPDDDLIFVYLQISDDKDYFITLRMRDEEYIENYNYAEYPEYDINGDDNASVADSGDESHLVVEMQIQTFQYEKNKIIWLSGNRIILTSKKVIVD